MNLEWTEASLRDRESIFDYIEFDRPKAAVRLDKRFEKAGEQLARFPRMGHAGRAPNTFEFAAHRNYLLIYEIDKEVVRILRVLHGARMWPPFPRRS
jgi:toxin ParE1/3/4